MAMHDGFLVPLRICSGCHLESPFGDVAGVQHLPIRITKLLGCTVREGKKYSGKERNTR